MNPVIIRHTNTVLPLDTSQCVDTDVKHFYNENQFSKSESSFLIRNLLNSDSQDDSKEHSLGMLQQKNVLSRSEFFKLNHTSPESYIRSNNPWVGILDGTTSNSQHRMLSQLQTANVLSRQGLALLDSLSLPVPLPLYMRPKSPAVPVSFLKPRKCRRSRTVFSEWQLSKLEQRFETQKYLSTPERSDLAEHLGLSQIQIKTWFQNRRMKWKKLNRHSRNIVN